MILLGDTERIIAMQFSCANQRFSLSSKGCEKECNRYPFKKIILFTLKNLLNTFLSHR